jgi:hypothetical protein
LPFTTRTKGGQDTSNFSWCKWFIVSHIAITISLELTAGYRAGAKIHQTNQDVLHVIELLAAALG